MHRCVSPTAARRKPDAEAHARYTAGYVFGIAVYLSVTVPSLRTIVTPVEGVDTREDRVEAMRILAAGNTIIIVIFGAILCLQARKMKNPCSPWRKLLTDRAFFSGRTGICAAA